MFNRAEYITPFSIKGKNIYGAAYFNDYTICQESMRGSLAAVYRHADSNYILPEKTSNPFVIYDPVLFLGHFFDGYGHFLLETLPMISYIINPCYGSYKFVFLQFSLSLGDVNKETSTFITEKIFMDILDILGLGDFKNKVIIYKGPKVLKGDFYIVPRPIEINMEIKDPQPYSIIINKIKQQINNKLRNDNYPLKVFLSRSYDRVDPKYASEIEDFCSEEGFYIIKPAALTFIQQVALIANAKIIAGFEGSQLHNTIFSNPGTVIIEFGDSWRPSKPNINQEIISKLIKVDLRFVPYLIDEIQRVKDYTNSLIRNSLT